jgi:hypothetical protein
MKLQSVRVPGLPLFVFSLFLIFFTLFPVALRAQDSSSITGVVTDSTGALLPDATVTLSNPHTGYSQIQTTDKIGSYHFLNVPAGEGYQEVFSHSGFSTSRAISLQLQVGITRTLNASLTAGSNQEVEVSASNQVTLDTTDATIGNNIDVQQLNDLPILDRTAGITTLFTLQPGVDSFQGSVTGARIDQTSVTVDGLDVNDIAAGTTFAIVGTAPVDSVEQFTGTVAGLQSAIGTGSGGQFQLVTKSGTNSFHGNLNEYHRDTTTEANGWFNNLIGLPRTPLIRNQFGGNIGGPIKRDKLFFFFDAALSRIVQSASAEPIVPLAAFRNGTLNYINSGPGCGDNSRLNITPTCITTLSGQQVAALDPQGIGFNAGELAYINGRYPVANDLTRGDGVNTGGFRFTTPTPNDQTTYVGRIDYKLNNSHRIYGRFTINRQNAIQNLPEFPSDPLTHPFIDHSYGYVVSDIWTIGKNKVNQFYYGDNISKFDFPDLFNPTGTNQYSLSGLSGPYTNFDGQQRRVPIPIVRDDFNWLAGRHSVTFGGTFKFIKTNSNLISNFNFVGLGLQGAALGGGLDPSLRPTDINTTNAGVALNDYDQLFTSSLGNIGQIQTNYTYNNTFGALPLGTGGPRAYRYFETELYVGDTWKITNKLTLSYGLRYQLYSVPYEAHGDESIPVGAPTLENYVSQRLAQSAAGNTSNTGLPFYSFELGGKANNAPPIYNPSYKDFAPRVAFAYSATPQTVINGGAGIVYDRTVINAVNFLQDQISYLFFNSPVNQFGANASAAHSGAYNSLAVDPRVGSNLSYASTLNPTPLPVGSPYTPFVSGGVPVGLAQGQTNFVISPNLKDPYSIALNAGVQQKLPGNFVMKLNYVGRLGRRLLADADAGQVIDFPDKQSGQSLSSAFASLTTQLRAGGSANKGLQAQPWFEHVIGPAAGSTFGFANYTSLVAAVVGQLGNRGDISDSLFLLAANGILPTNVGIPSQFGSNTYLTNQGNSNYNAMLLTLNKNMSHGLRFDVNYTWSHSIDNTSLSANNNSLFSNSGFICDILQPRACRGSSDFDIRQDINSDFTYDLPIGRGREFFGKESRWLDEAIGGWSISGLPSYRTGLAVQPYSDAFLASFDNQDPAIFTGNPADLKVRVNKSANGTVFAFAGGQAGASKVASEFRGPIGLEYGQRNIARGPNGFFLSAGLAKNFPIIVDKVNLKFRADGFNVLNHPVFGAPALNIVTNAGQFGQITATSSDLSSGAGIAGARVGQFSLRLEF